MVQQRSVTPEPPAQQAPAAPIQAVQRNTVAPAQGPMVPPAVEATGLPRLWAENIPQQDHKWVKTALFGSTSSTNHMLREDLRLWYHPPPPAACQFPIPAGYFTHDLLVWMPYKLWKVPFTCTKPGCVSGLRGAGLHKRARQVLDIDRVYFIVGEDLCCKVCKATYVSWSQALLQQLDLAHRLEFRVILTRK